MDPKDREPMAQLTQTPPPRAEGEPARLTATLAGDNDAVKNQAGSRPARVADNAPARRCKRGHGCG